MKRLMRDTVGFIGKLPHHLVASFKSTLEEITEADILLHLVDVSGTTLDEQISVVNDTLAELGVDEKPTLMVFNKVDRLADRTILQTLAAQYPRSVFISATRGINILGLKEEVLKLLEREFIEESFRVSQENQKLISQLHSVGEVLERTYEDNVVVLKMRIMRKERERLDGLLAAKPSPATSP